jgi:hypothetical protein
MPAAGPTRTPARVTTTSVNPRPDLPVNTTVQGLAGNSDGRRPWMDGKHADHRKTHRGDLHAAFSGSLRLPWLLLRVVRRR